MHAALPLFIVLLGASVSAWAQSSPPSLNLMLPAAEPSPPVDAPVDSKASTDTAATQASAPALPEPYDETYGDRRDAAEQGCDDKTYNQAQVHGSVSAGVAAGNRFSGNYQSTAVGVSKPLGSCGDPKGEVSASIRVTKSNLDFHRRNGQ